MHKKISIIVIGVLIVAFIALGIGVVLKNQSQKSGSQPTGEVSDLDLNQQFNSINKKDNNSPVISEDEAQGITDRLNAATVKKDQ